jgi:hypothetical protein
MSIHDLNAIMIVHHLHEMQYNAVMVASTTFIECNEFKIVLSLH